jgi:glycosyltransferase involved in cell wall biosynthesis
MGKHCRIVGMVAVKNEVQNVDRWLRRNGNFLDGIVALDDGSTDGTTELLRNHPKVISFTARPPGTPWYLVRNLQHILSEAKKTRAEWLFHLDADDVMCVGFEKVLDNLLKAKDVGRYRFREVTLWRSTENYRVDKPEKYFRITHYPTLMRNNEALSWVPIDEGLRALNINFKRRIVSWLKRQPYKPIRKRRFRRLRVNKILSGVEGRIVDLEDVVRIHYHYADWDAAWRKQIRYALNYAIALDYKPEEIDALFEYTTQRVDESGLQLAPVKPEWGVLE